MQVCVIGAGPSGLTAAKACLESGLKPTIFEARAKLGGQYTLKVDGLPLWSRDLTAFSDFSPDTLPALPPPAAMLRYLQQYASLFDLTSVLRTNCRVTKVEESYQDSKWIVTSTSEKGTVVERYDAVLVCSGRVPRPIKLPGQNLFPGSILHTQDIVSVADFRNQRVLVVGLDSGGLEIACRLTSVAAQVYISVPPEGAWLLPRISGSGSPTDLQLLSRWAQLLPRKLWLKLFAPLPLGPPRHHTHPQLLVSKCFPELLLSGALQLQGPLSSLTSKGAEFSFGGECELDAVIVASGHCLQFPFLDPGLVSVEKDRINLYKHVFPTQLPGSRPTLAFIGTVSPSGPRPPVAELQARWAVQVMAGRGAGLPNPRLRWTEVSDRALQAAMQGLPALHADWVSYMDELAALVGAQAPWYHLLGPCLPYHFRLRGPHASPTLANRPPAPPLPLKVLPPPPLSRHPDPISIFRLLILAISLFLLVAITTSAT